MLIGLTGKVAAGKDTVYERTAVLYPDVEVTRVGYADKMKLSIAALFGIDLSDIETAKRNEDSMVTFESGHTIVHQTFREFIQNYGTESHRGIFGHDFWLDAAVPLDFDHSGRIHCVTDIRFNNELQRVVDAGGFNILVENEQVSTDAEAAHPSERSINMELVSYTLDNHTRDDDFDALDTQLTSIIDQLPRTSLV